MFHARQLTAHLAAAASPPVPKEDAEAPTDGSLESQPLSGSVPAEITRRGLVRRHNSYSSRHKGVSLHKQNNTWKAQVYRGGKTEHLGIFATEDEAKAAYDARCLELGMDLGAGTSSGFRGVFWNAVERKWAAALTVDGEKTYLGAFEAAARGEVDAALAFDAAVRTRARGHSPLTFAVPIGILHTRGILVGIMITCPRRRRGRRGARRRRTLRSRPTPGQHSRRRPRRPRRTAAPRECPRPPGAVKRP